MQQDTLTFQLAVHFLPKVALRLERLFIAIEEACHMKHPIAHHYALKNIIEIIKLVEKPELKSRFVKELMRIEHMVRQTRTTISDVHVVSLSKQVQVLNQLAGRFGESIHDDPFLQSIRLAQTAHANDCELHAPQLLFWLENASSVRQDNLITWLKQLQILYETVDIYLALLRDTAVFEPIQMVNGFYQRSLPARANYHLILFCMDRCLGVVPKIQIGHHGLSIRLCDAYSTHEVRDTLNSSVELAICQL